MNRVALDARGSHCPGGPQPVRRSSKPQVHLGKDLDSQASGLPTNPRAQKPEHDGLDASNQSQQDPIIKVTDDGDSGKAEVNAQLRPTEVVSSAKRLTLRLYKLKWHVSCRFYEMDHIRDWAELGVLMDQLTAQLVQIDSPGRTIRAPKNTWSDHVMSSRVTNSLQRSGALPMHRTLRNRQRSHELAVLGCR